MAAGEDTTGAMQHELDKKAEEDETTGLRASIEKLVNILNPANLVALVLHAAAALVVGIIQINILGLGVDNVKKLVILCLFVFVIFGCCCFSCLYHIGFRYFKALPSEKALPTFSPTFR